MKWTNIGEIHMKWTNIGDKKHSLRNITNNDLKVPEKPRLKCMGFTYIHWSKVVQHATTSNEGNLQKCQKLRDGKTRLHINHFLNCCRNIVAIH